MERRIRELGINPEEIEALPLNQILDWYLEVNIIDPSWHHIFREKKTELNYICRFIDNQIAKNKRIVPAKIDIFRVFTSLALTDIRVVILGQDPYTGPRQAVGLAFSLHPRMALTPSLENIYREVKANYPHFVVPNHGDLQSWVNQGVFLLNSCLTVEEGSSLNSGSHGKIWDSFLIPVCKAIYSANQEAIFVTWGRAAQNFINGCDLGNIRQFSAAHPSGKNAYGFLECKHFLKINKHLSNLRQKDPTNPLYQEIDWQV